MDDQRMERVGPPTAAMVLAEAVADISAERSRLLVALKDAKRVLQRPSRPRLERFLDAMTDGEREALRDAARVDRAIEIINEALGGVE